MDETREGGGRKKKPASSRKADVTRILARRISSGGAQELPTQEQLAVELGVSRSILREACAVLQAKGLIDVRQKTGVIVRPSHAWRLFDPDVVRWRFDVPADARFHRDVLDFRNTIEVMAATLAAERASAAEVETARAALAEMARFAKAFAVSRARADFDGHARADARFHLTILEASRNQFLAQMAAIIESGLKLHNEYVAGLPRALERGLSYHRKVLRAIEARDPAAAGAAMSALLAFAGRDQRAHQRSGREG